MFNRVELVGRLTEDVIFRKENDKIIAILELAVSRAWKTSQGIYETDFITINISDGLAKNLDGFYEQFKKGCLIGVRGRLENADKNGIKVYAEKITFLSGEVVEK